MPAQWRLEPSARVPEPGAVILSCFPSAGLAATVAGHWILRALDLPRVGRIVAPELPPLAVIQGGAVNPPVRVHARKDLALVISEFPPPAGLLTSIAVAILDGADQLKASRVIGLEGVVPQPVGEEPEETELPTSDESVWFAGCNSTNSVVEELKRSGVRPLLDGVIGGVSGALLIEALARQIPTAAILVSANDVGYPDHRAAAKLIEVLDKILPHLQIDTRPLRTQAEVIEKALRAAIKAHAEAGEQPGRPPSTSEPTIYQ
jgi:predicted ATP-grasp superfamily ATP-dependent carboligase